MTRVFISYSRKDSVFSNRLVDALNARAFEAYLDKKDILPGEPWEERLDALILSADAVNVVITPDPIASHVCGWEAERAEKPHRKVLPLLHRPSPTPICAAQLYLYAGSSALATFAVPIETDIAPVLTSIGPTEQPEPTSASPGSKKVEGTTASATGDWRAKPGDRIDSLCCS